MNGNRVPRTCAKYCRFSGSLIFGVGVKGRGIEQYICLHAKYILKVRKLIVKHAIAYNNYKLWPESLISISS